MDISKLLPLLMVAKNGGGDQGNLNQILPELLKAQTGDNNALTGMLLNMLSSNFNKQNASCQTTQNNQAEMQNREFNTTNNNATQNTATNLKNYKNFYSPPEYNAATIESAKTEQTECQANTCAQAVYPSSPQTENKKNSVENNATNIKTPFGYTRLY